MRVWLVRILAWAAAVLCVVASAPVCAAPINAVVGDASWEERFGEAPIEGEADEVERIQTHLRYVIVTLRARSTRGLSELQRARRARLIDELEVYAEAGRFPTREAFDGHGVRRPRFIGANGVHCAVGEMIRVSGHGALARRIDQEYRYDYVSEMDVPELAAWADAWGFTATELGMIQPGYRIAAPNAESTRARLTQHKDVVSLTCSKAHGHDLAEVTVRMRGDDRGAVHITLVSPETGFAACVAATYQGVVGGRAASLGNGQSPPRKAPPVRGIYYAIDPSTIQEFEEDVRLVMPSPNTVFTRLLDTVAPSSPTTTCFHGPAPNPIIERVTVRLRADDEGASYAVSTVPESPRVQACLEERVRRRVVLSEGKWDVDVDKTYEVEPYVTDVRIGYGLDRGHVAGVNACSARGKSPKGPWRVVVKTAQDTQTMSVEVTGGGEAFEGCMEGNLYATLKRNLTLGLAQPDGSMIAYMRVDADLEVERVFGGEGWWSRWWARA